MIELGPKNVPFAKGLGKRAQALLEKNLTGVDTAGIALVNARIDLAQRNPIGAIPATCATDIKGGISQARINCGMPGETNRPEMYELADTLYRLFCTEQQD